MSELTDRLDDLCRRGLSGNDLCASQDELAVHLADELAALLPAHEAEVRREQMEAFCAALEWENEITAHLYKSGALPGNHIAKVIIAQRSNTISTIRAAYAKAHPEDKGKEPSQ